MINRNSSLLSRQVILLSIIAVIFLGPNNLYAQIKCNLIRYSAEDGLSNNRITNLIQDAEGYIWAGTWGGINRFNGRNFSSFKSNGLDGAVSLNGRVERIIDDHSGNLWLKGMDQRIYRFDKKSERFFQIPHADNDLKTEYKNIIFLRKGLVALITKGKGLHVMSVKNGNPKLTIFKFGKSGAKMLNSDSVNFVFQDLSKHLWVGTKKGIVGIHADKNNNLQRINKKGESSDHLNFTDFSEADSSIYFGTAQGLLIVLDKTNLSMRQIKVTNDKIVAVEKSKNASVVYCSTATGNLVTLDLTNNRATTVKIVKGTSILSIYEDHTGILWLEPNKSGVIRFNPSSSSYTWLYGHKETMENGLRKYNIFEDHVGRVWINVRGGGFGYYDNETEQIESNYLTVSENVVARFPELVNSCIYDPFGVIWLSTNKGIVKIILPNSNFSLQLPNASTTNPLGNNIRGILTDKSDRTWIGTKDGKVYLYRDGKKLNNPFDDKNVDFGPIYSILEDHHSNIWIGTKGNGLFRLSPLNDDKSRYKVAHFISEVNKQNTLISNRVVALFEDKQKRLWVGTFGSGICLVINQNQEATFLNIKYTRGQASKFKNIRQINSDKDNNLWLGTTDGLVILDIKGNLQVPRRSKIFPQPLKNKSDVQNTDVQHFFFTGARTVWISTFGSGIQKASFRDPFGPVTFHSYTRKNGLLSDYILSSTKDRFGKIWIATQSGLSRLDPEDDTFRNYSANDGVYAENFSEASVTRNASGKILFGTERGILIVNNPQIPQSIQKGKVVVTNLQINNQDVFPGDRDSILAVGIDYTDRLNLKYWQNTLSLDIGILDFKTGQQQNLLFRLKGYESKWQNSGNEHRATYTHLPPGKYQFELKNGKSSTSKDSYKTLVVTIERPFWRTSWAYLFYILCLAGLCAVIYRTVKTILLLKSKVEIEKKMAELKVDFFTNISHELRTPLTLIINPIKAIMEQEQLTVKGSNYIKLIHKNAERLTKFMDQWLDLRKIQGGKGELIYQTVEVVEFVGQIVNYFEDAGSKDNISIRVDCNESELYAWIDSSQIDIVLHNLIANAYKYAKADTTIQVLISKSKISEHFKIKVVDQGIGLPKDKLEKIFELYYVDKRDETRHIKGTGIGLALVKEIVGLHKGFVSAFNNEYGGLTVELDLPIGSISKEDAFTQEIMNSKGFVDNLPDEDLVHPEVANNHGDLPVLLIVEDNDPLRGFMINEFSKDYRVISAANGAIGLEMAIRLLPDLIVSDVTMPIMDGIEMLDKIKNNIITSHIPFILLTAKTSVEHQIQGLNYGADQYFTKPFHKIMLLAAMSNLIRQRRMLFKVLLKDKVQDLNKILEVNSSKVTITSRDENFLKEVIRVVEQGMSDPEFNIEMVAEALAMGRTTFYKKFKSLTGITTVDLIRDMRLKRAKQLIDAGEDRISSVAFEVGFSDPKYFSTCFKEKFGVAPTVYLKTEK